MFLRLDRFVKVNEFVIVNEVASMKQVAHPGLGEKVVDVVQVIQNKGESTPAEASKPGLRLIAG
jgi:hypothetical protein